MIVVLPMAGRGSRFEGAGYERPKPLILVDEIPMFLQSLKSLQGVAYDQLVIVALEEHEQQYGISHYVKEHQLPTTHIVWLKEVSQGQLCTVLAAKEYFDKDEEVLIISSDTIVSSDLGKDIAQKTAECDGLISVADMPGDRWSFAAIDEYGKVVEVAEKQRISPHASTGLYYFKRGSDLVRYGEEMIRQNEMTKGEYYVIPVYQKMIQDGKAIGISQAHTMWDLGTPQALSHYLSHRSASPS